MNNIEDYDMQNILALIGIESIDIEYLKKEFKTVIDDMARKMVSYYNTLELNIGFGIDELKEERKKLNESDENIKDKLEKIDKEIERIEKRLKEIEESKKNDHHKINEKKSKVEKMQNPSEIIYFIIKHKVFIEILEDKINQLNDKINQKTKENNEKSKGKQEDSRDAVLYTVETKDALDPLYMPKDLRDALNIQEDSRDAIYTQEDSRDAVVQEETDDASKRAYKEALEVADENFRSKEDVEKYIRNNLAVMQYIDCRNSDLSFKVNNVDPSHYSYELTPMKPIVKLSCKTENGENIQVYQIGKFDCVSPYWNGRSLGGLYSVLTVLKDDGNGNLRIYNGVMHIKEPFSNDPNFYANIMFSDINMRNAMNKNFGYIGDVDYYPAPIGRVVGYSRISIDMLIKSLYVANTCEDRSGQNMSLQTLYEQANDSILEEKNYQRE